jgi:hypothetical protein
VQSLVFASVHSTFINHARFCQSLLAWPCLCYQTLTRYANPFVTYAAMTTRCCSPWLTIKYSHFMHSLIRYFNSNDNTLLCTEAADCGSGTATCDGPGWFYHAQFCNTKSYLSLLSNTHSLFFYSFVYVYFLNRHASMSIGHAHCMHKRHELQPRWQVSCATSRRRSRH